LKLKLKLPFLPEVVEQSNIIVEAVKAKVITTNKIALIFLLHKDQILKKNVKKATK
jgi:hypothetical protein